MSNKHKKTMCYIDLHEVVTDLWNTEVARPDDSFYVKRILEEVIKRFLDKITEEFERSEAFSSHAWTASFATVGAVIDVLSNLAAGHWDSLPGSEEELLHSILVDGVMPYLATHFHATPVLLKPMMSLTYEEK